MVQQEMKRGPWTEQEDFKLVSFVGLFGDRRWDFIAKVSGLKVAGDKYIGLTRTGKSCRLRWVNYLHPGLKRGKLTPKEERLVMELHSKWGNRWSRIARKLPGRTDNEIKNYWRTHMRKKAQEEKRAAGAATSSPTTTSSCQSSSLSTISNNNNNNHTVNSVHASKKVGEEESFYDTGGPNNMTVSNGNVNVGANHHNQDGDKQGDYYSMDDIWKDIGMLEEENNNTLQQPVVYDNEHSSEECCNFSCPPILSPSWEYSSSEPLWMMDNEEESILQCAAFLEVIHGAIGLVPSGALLPLMQWGGRTHFLLAIVAKLDEVQELPSVFITFLAWSISEVIRYSHYAFSCTGSCPSWITYLRYTAFIVLYPLGVGPGEIWIMYQALPIVKKKNTYADSFSSLPFSYYDFLKVVLVIYPFLWLKLYLHMFKQRRSKLYKHHGKKRA